ncbi:MAG: membrane dipeptidase [Proteobacteria bacterium SG_bin5]|nr:MAG: membrane dipeptidase [Proteobacteria bacterium SG_bin5]
MAFHAAPAAAQTPEQRAERVLASAPVIDGHNDLAWAIREGGGALPDLTQNTAALPLPFQTDLPRARAGHLGGQFWSVYVPAELHGDEAVRVTLEQIDLVRRLVAANPQMALASSAAELRAAMRAGKLAGMMGAEGGHQIAGNLAVLRLYHALGVRYVTLTHFKSLAWADSSTDAPRANGLSDFGRAVIAEMNRIGMIVDVSHTSDATAAAAIAASRAPVIASHSGARAVTDAVRDLPDPLIRALAAKGGVVMVSFYRGHVSNAWRAWDKARTDFAARVGVKADVYGAKAPAPLVAWEAEHPAPRVTAADVADHVEAIARVGGKGAVGIGGDYEGIAGNAPEGMSGVDGYPALFAELARRGWSDAELAGLAQGNVLRVIEAVEAVARASAGEKPGTAALEE